MTDQNSNAPVDAEVVVTPIEAEATIEVASEEIVAPAEVTAEVAVDEVVAEATPEATA